MNKNKVLLSLLVLLSFDIVASPDLIDVYQKSLQNDPIFKQARATYFSSKESLPQAMSQLFPNVVTTGFINKIDYHSVNVNPLFGVSSNYRQNNYTLTATQPIFNYTAWMQTRLAKDTVKSAQATFNSAAQDLMIRTATAYFNVLQAKDNLRFALAKKRANYRQLDQARQRFKVGLDAITAVYEAQAAFDSSRAQVISNRNNLSNQYENLRKLTKIKYTSLTPLRGAHVPLIKPKPNNVMIWERTALKQNYQLLAAYYNKNASQKNIKVQTGGHLPTLNLQGSFSETVSNSPSPFLGSDVKQGTIGLALNFPIFQGGLVLSQVKQAGYDFENAMQQYQAAYLDTQANTHIAYNNITDGISTIRADRQAVKSAANSLESTETQFKVGTRTMVDVVNNQQHLFETQTNLAIDQYSYILSILQLKFQAGTLSTSDLAQINSWLASLKPYPRKSPQKPYRGIKSKIIPRHIAKKLNRRHVKSQQALPK
jgi:outer membrane protein